jgi:hypothetical protein
VLLLLAVILGIFAAAVIYYPVLPPLNPNAGFGPDWDCAMQAKGGGFCIKKLHPQ